jgi:hypothetical protein
VSKCFPPPSPHQHLLCVLFMIAILAGVRWSQCRFDLHFLYDQGCWTRKVGLFKKTHFGNLWLLIGVFRLFAFNIIIDMFGFRSTTLLFSPFFSQIYFICFSFFSLLLGHLEYIFKLFLFIYCIFLLYISTYLCLLKNLYIYIYMYIYIYIYMYIFSQST